MAAITVNKAIEIDAPIEKVRESICDYKQWTTWSPWLIAEPDARLTFNDKQGEVGASYTWDGKTTGEGEMSISEIADTQIDMDLTFIRPFRSKAKVSFILEEVGSSTKVSWTMYNKMAFFLFFMVKKMSIVIGMDYDRGLRMLKEYLETGSVSSKVEIHGPAKIKSQKYIGIKAKGTLAELSDLMPEHYEALSKHTAEQNVEPIGLPFSIYEKFELETQQMQFISAFPIEADAELEADGFVIDEVAKRAAIKVTHTGAYQHLGNAWSAAVMWARANKMKTDKGMGGVELYVSDPATTDSKDIITEIYLYLK